MYKDAFERIVAALPEACRAVYGDRLKSLALYGSVARGTMRPDSDIDVFLVVEPLPPSILDRWQEFEAVEKRLALLFDEAKRAGVHTFLSAAIKTPEELRQGSFLHLDLTDQAAVRAFFAQERPDHVYLAAARVGGIHANNTYPADFIRDNLLIATNVIDAAFHAGVKKLLFLGSSCIYPRLAPQPMPEAALLTGPLEPTNEPYAIAKIAGIKLCESYNRQWQ
jgi:predicted nucleotidyltransferase